MEEKNNHGDHHHKKDNHHDHGSSHHKKHDNNHHNSHSSQHHTSSKRNISSTNPWMISTGVLAVISLILLALVSRGGAGAATGTASIGETKAGEIVANFATAQGLDAKINGIEMESGLYKVDITVQGQDVPVYLTADGKSLIPSVLAIDDILEQLDAQNEPVQPNAQETPSTIPKTDKPKVELFVMTHCPYGTQAEKGFLPVMKILESKDLADVDVKFVHYFLHEKPGQEPDETPIQVCIREEQREKFVPYLEAFLADGDSDAAKVAAGVDEAMVQDCIDSGRAAEYYAVDSAASEAYGVRGSPTLIINGEQSKAGRSEAAYLSGVCDAFTDAPEICSSLSLDATNPAPGFGYGGSSAAATAAC